ncbi:Metal tolerance protein 1 [Ranunculus cassubicifolius]
MEDQSFPCSTMGEKHGDIQLQQTFEEDEDKKRRLTQYTVCDKICGLSKQANHKSETENRSKSSKKLQWLIVFCAISIGVEVVGGVMANSLAVLTDAAHMLIDVTGFSISLFAVWASGWEQTRRYSFGFFRLEVLGALLSVLLIWLIAVFLIYEAVQRILTGNVVVNGKVMFLTATFGFIINLLMVTMLGHDHSHNHHHGHDHGDEEHCSHETEGGEGDEKPLVYSNVDDHESTLGWILTPIRKLRQSHENMNVQGAYLHALGDLIQSLGVMIGGGIIWAKPSWLIVDLFCTLGFSVLVLLTTISMIRDIFLILMESTPRGIESDKLETGLRGIRGVEAVHDLHVWAVSAGKTLLSCHVIAAPGASSNEILEQSRNYCEREHGIHHVTIQIEWK